MQPFSLPLSSLALPARGGRKHRHGTESWVEGNERLTIIPNPQLFEEVVVTLCLRWRPAIWAHQCSSDNNVPLSRCGLHGKPTPPSLDSHTVNRFLHWLWDFALILGGVWFFLSWRISLCFPRVSGSSHWGDGRTAWKLDVCAQTTKKGSEL